ncbi:MAG: CoA transferase [Gammaproteobacteria bacterium]|nr:CoA transferase [Gammaproteobacteria bacterium]NNL99341.1 CoA transferase [Gammaproteobacteria bacterium]
MGPLNGLRIIEFAGIGPAPFAGMLLADLGADIVRIDRKQQVTAYAGQKWDVYNPGKYGVMNRGRRSVAMDLKHPDAVACALDLVAAADGLIEGFRPGVMERLGLGPEICLERNPGLVYGRMTGWGQTGPLAKAAGHDINYVALSGALNAIGPAGHKPVVPLNLAGDFGGGGMMLALGMASAFVHAGRSGEGQVVDAAMSDGAATLMSMMYGMHAAGAWHERGRNRIDGGAHFYDTYECADGRYISVGANEPKFYAELLERCGVTDPDFQDDRMNPDRWPALKKKLAAVFAGRPRDEWTALLEGTDVCFAPVLDFDEAPAHPHNQARGTFVTLDGVTQPAPAPRFSATPGSIERPPPAAGADTREVLALFGMSPGAIDTLIEAGAVA